MAEFKYDLVSEIAVLSDGGKGFDTEVNIISFNDGPNKLDIRKWNKKEDKMLRGITLSKDEAIKLADVLKDFDFSLLD